MGTDHFNKRDLKKGDVVIVGVPRDAEVVGRSDGVFKFSAEIMYISGRHFSCALTGIDNNRNYGRYVYTVDEVIAVVARARR